MKRLGNRLSLVTIVCVGVLLCSRPLRAEVADVYLKNGVTLRGDVTVSDDEVVIRNAAGEIRFARAEVERIVPVEAPATAPGTQPGGTSATTRATQPSTRPTTGPTGQAMPPEEEEPGVQELPAAPPVSLADIQRLRLHELLLDGSAEPVRVRFKRKPGERDLAADVLAELAKRPNYRAEWADTLNRGRNHEKLQLIVRETGAEHADRIEIQTDPEVFTAFRTRVLPLVTRGCGRTGCHGGHSAKVFRLPGGSTASEEHVYTTFVLLDQMLTPRGSVLERVNPEDSLLLNYLLPPEGNPRPHPPVKRGGGVKAVVRGKNDPQYQAVVDWINSLKYPHPDYGLEYQNPYRLVGAASQPATRPSTAPTQPTTRPATEPATAPAKPTTQPAMRPGDEK